MSVASPAYDGGSQGREPLLLSRRGLASAGSAAAVLLATGCTGPGREPTELPARPADPDERLVTEALAAERGLVGMLEATGRRHTGLRSGLREPLRIHRSHVRLLAGASDGSGRPDQSPSGSGPPSSPRVRTQRVPAQEAAAVAALVRAEGRLRDRHVETALRADSGVLDRLLAGLAAAAAQQEVLVPRVGAPVVPAADRPS